MSTSDAPPVVGADVLVVGAGPTGLHACFACGSSAWSWSRVLGAAEVAGVELTSGDGARALQCGRIIAALGSPPTSGRRSGSIDVENRRHIPVEATRATSSPGIFAAGDINVYPGQVRLIAVGFGEAGTAVNNAVHHLDPAALVPPGTPPDEPARARG
ncbi:hypothetical protein AB0F91_09010 [Amycolatopsis sp. NPDC023774]|uniref:hypothetical protein n=1 Tax=Amycolatopsis sp. NPDC023774 TaxID=3155015 RepID=UPI0033C324C5